MFNGDYVEERVTSKEWVEVEAIMLRIEKAGLAPVSRVLTKMCHLLVQRRSGRRARSRLAASGDHPCSCSQHFSCTSCKNICDFICKYLTYGGANSVFLDQTFSTYSKLPL